MTKKHQQTKPKKRKTKAKSKTKPELPKVKRKTGRPSKAELALREQEKFLKERMLKEELRAAQEGLVKTKVPVPTYPIFNREDCVRRNKKNIVTEESREAGRVVRQDIESPLVFVRWNSGVCNWQHATNLVLEQPPVKKTRTKTVTVSSPKK